MTEAKAPHRPKVDAALVRVHRYALDPTPAQERALASHAGAARFAYNYLLALVKAVLGQREAERSYGVAEEDLTAGVGWSAYSLRREWNVRKDEVAPWWGENSKEAYSSAAANLADALGRWKASRAGEIAGRPVGFPVFHGKRHRSSVTFTTGTMRLERDRHHVRLPVVGSVRTYESTRKASRLTENGRARITSITVSRHRGRWVASIILRLARAPAPVAHPNPGSVVGLDVGVKDLLVAATPEGVEVMRVPVPQVLRDLEARKAHLQRLGRNRQAPDSRTRQAPSNRWLRAQAKIDRLDHRAANVREDLLHKATTHLATTYEHVVVETLSVAAMSTRGGAYKKGLNRAIHRAAMGAVRTHLAYKTTRHGSTMTAVDRFYPSSKTCSACGDVRAKLTLAERTYTCTTCGTSLDRDLNAAINLARMAGSAPVTGRGAMQKTSHPRVTLAAGEETSSPTKGSSQPRWDAA